MAHNISVTKGGREGELGPTSNEPRVGVASGNLKCIVLKQYSVDHSQYEHTFRPLASPYMPDRLLWCIINLLTKLLWVPRFNRGSQ